MPTVRSLDIQGNEHEVPVGELAWRPAAYAIVVNDGKILLTKQHGAFHLPGGGVEFGELPEDAVVREAQEETGFTVANPRLVDCISGFFTYFSVTEKRLVHVQSILLYYRCDFAGGEASIDGFDDYEKMHGELPEWIPLDKLDTIQAGSTIDWRVVVKKALVTTQK